MRTAQCRSPAGRTALIAFIQDGPSMAHRRHKIDGASILLQGGEGLATSGAPVAELRDFGKWTFCAVPRRFLAAYRSAVATALREGEVFIAGGYSDRNPTTAGVWLFGEP